MQHAEQQQGSVTLATVPPKRAPRSVAVHGRCETRLVCPRHALDLDEAAQPVITVDPQIKAPALTRDLNFPMERRTTQSGGRRSTPLRRLNVCALVARHNHKLTTDRLDELGGIGAFARWIARTRVPERTSGIRTTGHRAGVGAASRHSLALFGRHLRETHAAVDSATNDDQTPRPTRCRVAPPPISTRDSTPSRQPKQRHPRRRTTPVLISFSRSRRSGFQAANSMAMNRVFW